MHTNSQSVPLDRLLSFSFRRRLPVILQTEAAECGLACLAMVASYHGFNTDLNTVRQQFSISSHGATLKQVMDIASQLELSTRALRLEPEDMSQLQLPCILHWEMKHFVVLKAVKRQGVVIHDPASGERRLDWASVSNCFTGVALELAPTQDFTPRTAKRQLKLRHFWSRIRGLKSSLALIIGLSLFLQIFAVIAPYYMQIVIDDVVLRADLNLLTVVALGFGLLLVLETATRFMRQTVSLSLSSRLNIQMAANIFRHLIRLPMTYFSKRHMGDIVSRFSSVNQIREMMTHGLVAVMIDGLMALITLVVMFFYSAKLTFLVLIVVTLYALLRYLFYTPLRLLSEEHIVAAAKENTHFMESVRAVQTIKLFSKESDRESQWQNKLADSMNRDIRLKRWGISFDSANHLLFGIENILVIYFAAVAVTENVMSVGMLYAYVSYKTRFIDAMDNLIVKLIEFRMLDLHFDRLADIVFTTPDDSPTGPQPAISGDLAIPHSTEAGLRINNLTFRYSASEAPIFSGLSFDVMAGETLAIVGPSGSGKSTLMKCLMGLYLPDAGSIQMNGHSIQSCPDYRKKVAAVMQDDELMTGSVAENIACFDAVIDFERIVQCAHIACIHEEIMAMPMQYNTLVGELGTNFSGGQKQRIVLARALYRQPLLLFMDEATSHLDTSNEQQINQHIQRMSITRILVAHRPDTIRSADRILSLANGELTDVTQQVKP